MDERTKVWVRGLIEMYRGDHEAVARYIAKLIRCGIRQARPMVAEAAQ